MKVIDLLNKMAKGEKVPKKIKIGISNVIFELCGSGYIYSYLKEGKINEYDILEPDYINNLNENVIEVEDEL